MGIFGKSNKKENSSNGDAIKATEYNAVDNEKLGDKVQQKDWDGFKGTHNTLYISYVQELQKKAKLGMNVGFIGLLIGLGGVGWHLTNPITNTEPYILRVDSSTGSVDVVSTVKNQEISQGIAVDRYWVAEFVRSYEAYSYQSIQYTYDKTLAMSSPAIAKQYERIFEGVGSRQEVLGETGTRKVNVKSVLIDETGVARVRFDTTTDRSGEIRQEYWVATVAFEYDKKGIKDDKRLLNPLGFVVKSYTIGSEVVQ